MFFDGERNWLADGFHRLEAHHAAGLTDIAVDVRNGSQRDATLFAAGANASHGLRRTQADKAKAIAVLLADPEWRQWSDKELARRCGISDKTVAKARRELSGVGAADPRSGVDPDSASRVGPSPAVTGPRRRARWSAGRRPDPT